MGYDAYVRCNRYKMGRVKSQPPFPFDYYDAYGDLRPLTDDCEKDINSPKCSEQWQAIYEWMDDACEHQGMKVVGLHVANIWGMSDFKWALGYMGWNHFPTLQSELPVANGGFVEATLAVPMLKELEYFMSFDEIAIGTYLLDSSTRETIYDYIGRPDGVFSMSGKTGIDLGLDADGFFVRKRPARDAADVDENMEIFRSMRLEQRLYYPKSEVDNREADYFEKFDEAEIELINLETNHRLVVKHGVLKIINSQDRAARKLVYPRFLHVEKRQFGSERYADILDSLKQLCEASIATGNPIIWC
jgi:hypothetical protein